MSILNTEFGVKVTVMVQMLTQTTAANNVICARGAFELSLATNAANSGLLID